MDPSAAAAMAGAGGGAPEENIAEKLQISIPSLVHNSKIIENIRGTLSIVGGCATGILGATGLQGLGLFLVLYIATSLGLLVKMRGDISSYLPISWYSFLLADAANHALSFMLFWTMLYTLIYIY